MVDTALTAVVLAAVWVVLSGDLSVETFGLGFVLGLLIIAFLRTNTGFGRDRHAIPVTRVPSMLFAFFSYGARLAIDILLSGVDVARRILPREMKINPGIYRISTSDPEAHSVVAALSAHAITITPGSMVIDYDQQDETIMVVHTLDVDTWSKETMQEEQNQRLSLIRRILGYD